MFFEGAGVDGEDVAAVGFYARSGYWLRESGWGCAAGIDLLSEGRSFDCGSGESWEERKSLARLRSG